MVIVAVTPSQPAVVLAQFGDAMRTILVSFERNAGALGAVEGLAEIKEYIEHSLNDK